MSLVAESIERPISGMLGASLLGQGPFAPCRLTWKIDSRHTNSSRFEFNSWGLPGASNCGNWRP